MNSIDKDESLTPEELAADEAKRKKAAEWIELFGDMGLQWKEGSRNELIHPEDPELNAWRHPYTHDLLLSPKLQEKVASIAKQAGADRGNESKN